MKIEQIHQLNEEQKLEIENLVLECLLADGLERTLYLSNDMNFYENLDSFYLLYDNKKLVSVLTIFEPLETEAEISAYTLPKERNKGYFNALLDYAEEELVGFDIVHIIFVIEPASVSGINALNAYQASYIKSEYLLIMDNTEWKHSKDSYQSIELRELQPQNVTEAANLSAVIFGTNPEEDLILLNNTLPSKQVESYCAYIFNNMIGVCNVNYGTHNACIFGFGISPEYQEKGYGKSLLNLLIAKITAHKTRYITLEVGSENQRAFSLYKSAGFQIKTQYDYYEYIIECEELN